MDGDGLRFERGAHRRVYVMLNNQMIYLSDGGDAMGGSSTKLPGCDDNGGFHAVLDHRALDQGLLAVDSPDTCFGIDGACARKTQVGADTADIQHRLGAHRCTYAPVYPAANQQDRETVTLDQALNR